MTRRPKPRSRCPPEFWRRTDRSGSCRISVEIRSQPGIQTSENLCDYSRFCSLQGVTKLYVSLAYLARNIVHLLCCLFISNVYSYEHYICNYVIIKRMYSLMCTYMCTNKSIKSYLIIIILTYITIIDIILIYAYLFFTEKLPIRGFAHIRGFRPTFFCRKNKTQFKMHIDQF